MLRKSKENCLAHTTARCPPESSITKALEPGQLVRP